jgi:peptidoglycan/LPS O-acetylase OafA/YrhL
MPAIRSERLDALTGLRFFAAFAIVLHHLPGTFGITHDTLHGYSLAQGVTVFFVLSGFVMRYAYPSIQSKREALSFLANRIARVWPAHVVMLACALLIIGTFSPGTFAANLFLLQAWIPRSDYFFSYNAVSWSISTELSFYLAFPILILGFARNWPVKLVASVLVVILMVKLCNDFAVPQYDGLSANVVLQGFIMTNPLARMFEFVLGMTVAELWLRWRHYLPTSKMIWSSLEAIIGLMLLFNVSYIFPTLWSILPHSDAMTVWVGMSLSPALPTALLVIVLAEGKGLLASFFGTRALRFLGDVSFSIYMTHQLILYHFQVPAISKWPPQVQLLAYFAVVFVSSVALYLLVERPCQGWVKWRLASPARNGARNIAVTRT